MASHCQFSCYQINVKVMVTHRLRTRCRQVTSIIFFQHQFTQGVRILDSHNAFPFVSLLVHLRMIMINQGDTSLLLPLQVGLFICITN